MKPVRPTRTSVELPQGRIVQLRDGIANVSGIPGCMAAEELVLKEGLRGLALRLEEDQVVCAVLDHWESLRVGDPVHGMGRLLHIPCSDALLGRVVDPLGKPLDDRGPIPAKPVWPLDPPGFALNDIQPVRQSLATGLKFIDVLGPLARGESRLLLGPRRSGKTTLGIDALLSQGNSDVLGVYVAIGQPRRPIAAMVETLRRHGVLDRTIVVAAWPDDPPAMQMLAARSGCALALFFAQVQGQHVLCVLDDLNHAADAVCTLFELLHSPTARWAHRAEVLGEMSRILERAAQLAERWVIVPSGADPAQVHANSAVNRNAEGLGVVYVGPLEKQRAQQHELPRFPGHQLMRVTHSGGSVTTLSIVETGSKEVAFLPSETLPANEIGLLVMNAHSRRSGFSGSRFELHRNVRRRGPFALRVLRKLQDDLWKSLWGLEELEQYAATVELDKAAHAQLQRGIRLRELLSQPPGQPLAPVDQVISLCAGLWGFLDDVPVQQIGRFEADLLASVHHLHPEILPLLMEVQQPYSDSWQKTLSEVIHAGKQFLVDQARQACGRRPTGDLVANGSQ